MELRLSPSTVILHLAVNCNSKNPNFAPTTYFLTLLATSGTSFLTLLPTSGAYFRSPGPRIGAYFSSPGPRNGA